MRKKNKKSLSSNDKGIKRREAMKKMGYTALSVGTMLILLNQPGKAQDTSATPDNPDTW
jgi:hypothetical protein